MVDSRVDFGFAFNNPQFSDRVLRVEIAVESLDSKPVSPPGRNKKRKGSEMDIVNDPNSCTVVNVTTFHISSPILAGNSPFFYKLFQNGSTESHHRNRKDVTLRINKSEEASLTELLSFMYCSTLTATTLHDLLGVLAVANKFEVTCCVRYCSKLLQKMPMSLESALLYLKLTPTSMLVGEVVQPLIDAARKWLVERYRHVNKLQGEAMALPLSVIQVVLDSQSLQVSSSDDVFEFILEWARVHYPILEERRDILSKCLIHFIRFQYMSCSKLRKVLVCPEFDHEQVSNLVLEALFFKVEGPYRHNSIHDSNNCVVIKVEQFRCFVYFDLKKEECESLVRPGRLDSPLFRLDERWFRLFAQRSAQEHPDSLGLFVVMTEESESCRLEYEFSVLKKSFEEFQSCKPLVKLSSKDELMQGRGFRNLLETPWTDLMDKDNEYFIDGILHLRADLTIKNIQA